MSTSTIVTTEHTELLQKVVKEIVNDPSTYLGAKYLPSVALPVRKVRVEVWEATGGLTKEHVVGTDPTYIQSGGFRTQEFEPPAYKEKIIVDEKEILYLREVGMNDRSQRGVKQYIDRRVDQLNRRLEARIEKLRWDVLLTSKFSYQGVDVDFGIPAGNRATPSIAWSTDNVNANNSADPVKDLRYWIHGGLAAFRKYKITGMICNPNTARWIMDNTAVQSLVKTYFSAENFGAYEPQKTLQMLIPQCPPLTVYNGWYQSESVVSGKLTVGNAIYMIPDGYILFEVALPGGDQYGEFVQGLNLASGSVDAPGAGKFLIVEDNSTPGSKGGPGNPYIDIIAGVYGGPKLDRPFDVLTAFVGT